MHRRTFIEKSARAVVLAAVGSVVFKPARGFGAGLNSGSDGQARQTSANQGGADITDYYISRKSELLKNYDKGAKPLNRILSSRFGEKKTTAILLEIRRDFESLIPELPYIGGEANLNTGNLIMASSCAAIYRILKDHGLTVEEVGRIIYDLTETLVDYPKFILQLFGRIKFGQKYEKKLKVWARESQKRRYPEDWVATFIEGDRREFDYGLDMTECGILKFFQAQNVAEITPYVCVSMDGIFSKAFNRGLVRTMTLAEGCDRCDFRYKMGRETFLQPLKNGWPPQFKRL